MNDLYSIQRTGEYLEHYGVKGMKWHNHKYADPLGSKLSSGVQGAFDEIQSQPPQEAVLITEKKNVKKDDAQDKAYNRSVTFGAMRAVGKETIAKTIKQVGKGNFRKAKETMYLGALTMKYLLKDFKKGKL